MGVKLAAASGGSIELVPTNTASAFTVTVPAVTATVLTDSAGILNIGSGQIYKDASGNVGIGTSSPSTYVSNGGLAIAGAFGTSSKAMTIYNTSGANASNVARIDFKLNNTFANASTSAAIYGINPNASGNNGGALVFAVSPEGTNTDPAERARIDSSGNLLVGTTGGASSGINIGKQYGGVNLAGGGGNWTQWGGGYGIFPYAGVGLGIATSAAIGFVGPTGTQIASINGTSGVYTPLSDAAKKKDFEDSNVGLEEVLQLKPKLFRMLDDANDAPKQLGFIAQEVKLFVPQAYVENKISEDQTFIGLQDRPLVAALVKAIQEQQALIVQLQADVAALKGAQA